ncbi:DUF6036 family nucleotidyltransferase [Mycobacterium hubeiense]|uniref:DUF6036 family nucleotidyltransferase n=1 Tax=Mycobacterium hubeiense TaxID=1867256 RepID=UPI000C7F3A31|nr:DUF6036 family nucleotidyltransferase [Mycobacterium sp. QGD 101]
MHLDRDFHEFVASCIDHDVRFLIVGGYALAAHGLPRATGDLDAWVWTDPSNAQRLLAALSDFGFGSVGLSTADLERPDAVVQLGYPPHRIDILTGIDGVDFESAWNNRIEIDIDGMTVSFIGKDDLIRNKLATGRPQDIADVARLRGEG